jgi:hypothetical protein
MLSKTRVNPLFMYILYSTVLTNFLSWASTSSTRDAHIEPFSSLFNLQFATFPDLAISLHQRFLMEFFNTICFLVLAALSFVASTPVDTTSVTTLKSAEELGANRRGVSFNDKNLVHLFNGPNNKIGWMYNWASDLCGSAGQDTGFDVEYVPVLHSNREDHVRPW